MNYYLENQIIKSETTIINLGDVCSLVKGIKINSKKGKETGKYPLYYCSILKCLYLDDYTYDGEGIIINKTNGSGKSMVYYHNGKYNVGNTTIHLNCNSNILKCKYLYYYLFNNLKILENKYKGSLQKSIDNSDLFELQMLCPSLEIQNEIIEYLDTLENKKNSIQEEVNQIDILMKDILEQSYQ